MNRRPTFHRDPIPLRREPEKLVPRPIRPKMVKGQAVLPGFEPPRETLEPREIPDRLDLMYKYNGIATPDRLCFSCRHFAAPVFYAENDRAFPRCAKAMIKATYTHPWHGDWRGCGLHERPNEHAMTEAELAEYFAADPPKA